MTLQELNYTFFKAHILMGAGYVLGEIVANGPIAQSVRATDS